MPSCAVVCCTTYNKLTRNSDVKYHSFPKDPYLLKIWLLKCKRDDLNIAHARVCSKHFTVDDYERDLKSELLGLPLKRKLKSDAVPSRNLSENSISKNSNCRFISFQAFDMQSLNNADDSKSIPNEEITKRSNRNNARNVRKRALETISNLSPKKLKCDQYTSTDETIEKSREEKDMLSYIKILEARNKTLTALNTKLKIENKILKCKVSSLHCKLNENSKNKTMEISTEVHRHLRKLFTYNQITHLINEKKCAKWDRVDICHGITLRAISRKCYLYLIKNGFPFPSISTLKRWISKSFKCQPGILHDVLQLLKMQGLRKTELERICVICFDEMNVDSRICYNKGKDKTVVQVVMVRGLFDDWKTVVFYDFDKNMSSQILLDIIISLEKINFKVVAVISELDGNNIDIWNELNITEKNSSFLNPFNSQNHVWVFTEVLPLFKLLRNHFLDDGFTLPDFEVTKTVIQDLIAMDNGEIKMCPQLSIKHVTVEYQRVDLTTQLFSDNTAKAIEYLMPDKKKIADFFQLISNSFDILNSHNSNDSKLLARGFGADYRNQEITLSEFRNSISQMKVGKTSSHHLFQKGFLVTINSLLGLYNDLKKSFPIEYILMANLNRNCLKNFFNQFRGLGYFSHHPLPADVQYRIRLLLLGADEIPLSGLLKVEGDKGFL